MELKIKSQYLNFIAFKDGGFEKIISLITSINDTAEVAYGGMEQIEMKP